MAVRKPIAQFELANPLYKNASVSFWTVANGLKTATLANLYAGPSGVAQLPNPQKLNSQGQFKQPVYIQDQVIGTVTGISVASHDTCIISSYPSFEFSVGGLLQYSYDDGVTWNNAGTLAVTTDSSLVGFLQSGAGAGARTLQGKGRDIVSVTDFFANGANGALVVADGAGITGTDNTGGIQAALNSGAGTVWVPGSGSYLTDTIKIPTGMTLDLGRSTLLMKAHTTTHNPMIRMGDGSAAVNHAGLRNGKLVGNSASQTYALEESSPGVWIWGSDHCFVENVEITDCKGDGVAVGYDSARLVGSNGNRVQGCECYANMNTRQAISITWGCENKIIYNKCSGTIDLEIDVGFGECKNNLIHGNTGRSQAQALTTPRISDLVVSCATLSLDKRLYSGNIITNNHCNSIHAGAGKKFTINDNYIVGSNSSQARLINLDNVDESIINGNTLVANSAIATSLVSIIRTRGGINIKVTDNEVANDAIVFHDFLDAVYNGDTPLNQFFRNNQLSGTGPYRSGSCESATEWARFRLDHDPAGAISITRIAGVPDNYGYVVRSSGGDPGSPKSCQILQIGQAGTKWLINFLPQCNATTILGATDTPQTHNFQSTYSRVAGGVFVVGWYNAPAAGAVALTSFDWTITTGTKGSVYFDAYF